MVAITVVALLAFTTARPPPRPPLPIPNGFDDFLAACDAIKGDLELANSSTNDLGVLTRRDIVAPNAEPLRLLRLGLSRRCAVPSEANFTNHQDRIKAHRLRGLCILLAAEGQLAELEKRPADAARTYVDAIHFGNEVGRGSFLINDQVGRPCAASGSDGLAKLVPGLACEEARPLITRLENIDGERMSWDEVWRIERAYDTQFLHKSANPIKWVTGLWWTRRLRQFEESRYNIALARLRLLRTELSLRCYLAEQGRAPNRLEQLVPKYLQNVPFDPFGGNPLVYRAQGTNWLLYSVGKDGVDDGGKRVGTSPASKGDLFFDSPT